MARQAAHTALAKQNENLREGAQKTRYVENYELQIQIENKSKYKRN